MKAFCWLFIYLCFVCCTEKKHIPAEAVESTAVSGDSLPLVGLQILGIVQDAGRPHIGCRKNCCLAENLPRDKQLVVALGIWDKQEKRSFLLEATPDIAVQLENLSRKFSPASFELPNGIFLTHAHIGHYSGLMYLGREALDAKRLTVYAMPRMAEFLSNNGPWSQLVHQENIILRPLEADKELLLSRQLSITPFMVPHRDEYSETVGFLIRGPHMKVLFIPDINKWELWDRSIVALLAEVDMAFIDGSFYNGDELPHRDMSEIPHPFIVESMSLFDSLPETERKKVHFIHLNHTNPLLNSGSEPYMSVELSGYAIAKQGEVIPL